MIYMNWELGPIIDHKKIDGKELMGMKDNEKALEIKLLIEDP